MTSLLEQYGPIVAEAKEALETFKRWEYRKLLEFRAIRERLKEEGYEGKIRAHPDIQRWLNRNPRPPTADQVLERVTKGDQVLWTKLANLLTDPEEPDDHIEDPLGE